MPEPVRRPYEVCLAWSYDRTDNPVLPFDGTALAVALDYRSLEAELARTSGAGPAGMRSELLRVSVLGRRHWPFARCHSFAAGLGLTLGRVPPGPSSSRRTGPWRSRP